jgi:hypothetical protein
MRSGPATSKRGWRWPLERRLTGTRKLEPLLLLTPTPVPTLALLLPLLLLLFLLLFLLLVLMLVLLALVLTLAVRSSLICTTSFTGEPSGVHVCACDPTVASLFLTGAPRRCGHAAPPSLIGRVYRTGQVMCAL